uniref:Uncharacterized protein n=1 Tax=Solanum lycopersicum TaxID=4081 RepID=A0A3Q7JAU6_SOLLC
MSFVTFKFDGDDISEYACRNVSYEQDDKNEFCDVYDGPYENGNGTIVYDGHSYVDSWDNEQDSGENYYSKDDFEMNGTYDSCDDVEGVEEA